ncbi:molybdopterin-dependent oxidoreductase [Cupriavidus plantarum]|uniref:molybdopterin-dependent oxidoreductase n=1 Tax=Cupriavidus plantarum TaxID=942865 RepID=UPI00339D6999
MAVEKKGFCTLCRSRCGTINVVDGDTLVEVRPDPTHPTGRAMCLKGKSAPELVHSADRVLHPMRRTRPKGAADAGWERISWEDALTEVATRLAAVRERGNPESVAFAVTTPSGTPLTDSIDWIERFVRGYGSPNIIYATEICNWHKDFAHVFTFGCGIPTADYTKAELILLWGHNPTNTWLAQAEAIGTGRAAGARMIVVDPRRTALAGQADQWLRVKPGTDAALAMAIANLLIEANAFDAEFVRRWSNGPLLVRGDNGHFVRGRDVGFAGGDADAFVAWDAVAGEPVVHPRNEGLERIALRGTFALHLEDAGTEVLCEPAFERYARACAQYPVDVAASLTWIPEGDIRHAASLIGSAIGANKRIAYHAWSGVGQHENATQTERAIACLYALTGSFDVDGGNRIHRKPPHQPVNGLDLLTEAQHAKALGIAERPLGPAANGWVTGRDFYHAVLDAKPYRVDTLVAFGTNLLMSQPDVELGDRALRALDFHVHCDLFMTPSAQYADIFLPINTPWEREGLRIGFEITAEADQLIQLRQRMVPPRGESRADNDIVFDLATRIGMGDLFFDGSLERGWNHMLAPSGVDVAALRGHPEGIRIPTTSAERKYRTQPKPFATPTGLVELYSERLLAHGYAPLPAYEVHRTDDDVDFPLVMTSAKSGYYCHSQHRGNASLRRRAMRPSIDLSGELARSLGVEPGDLVRVTTPGGMATFIARIDPALHPAVVVGEYGWWQACDALGQPGYDTLGGRHSNYNALVGGERQDPVSGSTPLRAYCCRVEIDPAFDRRRAWEGFRPFRVAALAKEASDVTTVRMEALDGGLLHDFSPGQNITIRLRTRAGTDVIRSYSLTGPAAVGNRRHYSISVRRASGVTADGTRVDGIASTHINGTLAIGDVVDLRAPSGTFVMPRQTGRPLILVAGGIGITPFMNLLESLVGEAASPRIVLLYANRHRATHAFRERLQNLRVALPSLSVIDYYEQPGADDIPGKDYDVHGRISPAHIDDALLALRPLIYMCGPPAMMDAFAQGMIARGVPRFDILREVFRSPVTVQLSAGQQYRVQFARADRALEWKSEDGSLLAFSERHGVHLPSGCRVGQCESCAVKILHGSVRHLHGQEPDDADTCLACQAIPTSDVVLDA